MRSVARNDDPTVADGARVLRTRVNYIYGLLSAGILDGYKTPQGRWRIRRASLDHYLKHRAAPRQVTREEEEGVEIPA
jgi:excisionase family DNA binding protein